MSTRSWKSKSLGDLGRQRSQRGNFQRYLKIKSHNFHSKQNTNKISCSNTIVGNLLRSHRGLPCVLQTSSWSSSPNHRRQSPILMESGWSSGRGTQSLVWDFRCQEASAWKQKICGAKVSRHPGWSYTPGSMSQHQTSELSEVSFHLEACPLWSQFHPKPLQGQLWQRYHP